MNISDDSKAAVKLAEIILSKFGKVEELYCISFKSDAKMFLHFENEYIEVSKGENTKSLEIRIGEPLSGAFSNPVLQLDDKGECYRTHGEIAYFVYYAEKFLELPQSTFGMSIEREKEIDNLFC